MKPPPTRSQATLTFDPELIRRYAVHAPRYTSYPTAPYFRPDFDVGAYRKAALLSNDAARALSIYVHVPFCTSPCFYCGCHRLITRSKTEGARYVHALETEISLQAALFSPDRIVEQIHFGGGTPTFLRLAQIEQILRRLRREFSLAPARQRERESSIEIDPRTVDAATIGGLAALGFDLISLGIQDFDPAVQAAVNRVQSVERTRRVVEEARRHGIESINFDLIYGLPRQTVASFARTLDRVLEMRPTRIAAYGYAHMPQLFKAQRRIHPVDLPDSGERLALLELTIERLNAAGYVYVGMDHFALEEDALAQALRAGTLQRDFQGYSPGGDRDLIGLGITSIGKVGDAYAQNTKTLREYYHRMHRHQLAIERGLTLTSDDRIRRDVIQRLMCQGIVDLAELGREHCIDAYEYFAVELARLRSLERDGLVVVGPTKIEVTPRGRLLVRNIAAVFDVYLPMHEPAAFSKAI